MSHVAVIKTEVKSLDALKAACKKMGLEFREGKTTYRWYGTWVRDYGQDDAAYLNGVPPEDYGKNSEHAIGIPGNSTSYEIGVVKNRDSDGNELPGWKLVWDFWAGGKGLDKYVGGADAGKLVAQYSVEALKEEAILQGYAVTEGVDEQGNIQLEMEDYAYAG